MESKEEEGREIRRPSEDWEVESGSEAGLKISFFQEMVEWNG